MMIALLAALFTIIPYRVGLARFYLAPHLQVNACKILSYQ